MLHLIPSGVLQPGQDLRHRQRRRRRSRRCWSTSSTRSASAAISPTTRCLKISDEAHLILPYHKAIDLARERLRGKGEIGTTGRGIGPAYEDKIARTGIRIVDLLDEAVFREKLERNIEEKNLYLKAILQEPGSTSRRSTTRSARHADALRPYVTDTALYLHREIEAGRRVLFEGAQGTMLDVDHGTYPYVTSSNTRRGRGVRRAPASAPGACSSVIGICKAYTTRVGNGPFPTEEHGEIGVRLRETGDEFGATTGRPRRCGWFDAVLVRQAARLNGLTGIALTKLDVLTGLDPLRICTAYRADGERFERVPASVRLLDAAVPEYEELPGWTEPLVERAPPGGSARERAPLRRAPRGALRHARSR